MRLSLSLSLSLFLPNDTYGILAEKHVALLTHCRCRSWTTQSISGLNLVRAKRLQARMKSP